jgi:hypothetical protein
MISDRAAAGATRAGELPGVLDIQLGRSSLSRLAGQAVRGQPWRQRSTPLSWLANTPCSVGTASPPALR